MHTAYNDAPYLYMYSFMHIQCQYLYAHVHTPINALKPAVTFEFNGLFAQFLYHLLRENHLSDLHGTPLER